MVPRSGIAVRSCSFVLVDAKPDQVDLSTLFPEPSTAEEHPATSVPVFLLGEKRQAFRTSKFIPQVKTIERVNRECSPIQFRDYLYVTFHLYNNVELIP